MDNVDDDKVTLAVVRRDIQHLSSLLERSIADNKRHSDGLEARLRRIEVEQLPELSRSVTAIEERQGVLAAAQATFTTIAAVLAAWFGSQG